MRQEDPGVALAQSPLVARLPAELREEFVAACKVRAFRASEPICLVGDPPIGPTWIEHGLLKVHTHNAEGRLAQAGLYWGGDILLGAFYAEWTGNLTAIAATTLCSIPRATFERMCETSAQLSFTWIKLAAEHTRSLQRREALLRSFTLRPRLLLLLGVAADLVGTPTPEGILLDFPLTHATLSCGTWVSRDETGRALRDLEQQGYLRTRPRHRLLIPDRRRLEDYHRLHSEDA